MLLWAQVSADLCLCERPVPGTDRLFLAADGLKEPLMGLVLLLDRRGGVDSALGLTDLGEGAWLQQLPGRRDVHEDH